MVRQAHHERGTPERGASRDEVVDTVEGQQFPARFGQSGFRQNFAFEGEWRGRRYATKQVEAIAVLEDGAWLVLTVIVKYF